MQRVLLTGVLLATWTGAAPAAATEYFKETVKDFGTTPRGPVLVHYFTVTNTSGQPVDIGQPRVSCGCVSASVLKNRLAAGEATAVVAQMDTRRIPQAGVVKSVIVYVPFLSPVHEEVHLRVQAIARDDLVLSPETLALGTVRAGQGGKASVKVTLFNQPGWKVTDATSSGAYVKPVVKEVDRQATQVTYEVTATLDSKCPVGNWTADVWLTTNAPGAEKLRLPLNVNVVSPIVVKPDAVAFGDVAVGASAEQRVILQATSPFGIKEIKGADGVVEVSKVADGARPVHILKLALSPKKAGAISQSLEIVTDSKEMPTITVPLTARVVQP